MADDELRREQDPAGDAGALQEPEEGTGRLAALGMHSLADSGQGRVELGGEVEVVEAGQGDLVGHRQPTRAQLIQGADGGGVVEMSANRPFGVANWPTWWLSEMAVDESKPAVRFRHIGGVTREMDVEWSLTPSDGGTHVRLVHVWDGPRWPLIGGFAATAVIGPVFIHGIASRTLAGLAKAAERARLPEAGSERPTVAESRVTQHASRVPSHESP